jgi:hypothetical protein
MIAAHAWAVNGLAESVFIANRPMAPRRLKSVALLVLAVLSGALGPGAARAQEAIH